MASGFGNRHPNLKQQQEQQLYSSSSDNLTGSYPSDDKRHLSQISYYAQMMNRQEPLNVKSQPFSYEMTSQSTYQEEEEEDERRSTLEHDNQERNHRGGHPSTTFQPSAQLIMYNQTTEEDEIEESKSYRPNQALYSNNFVERGNAAMNFHQNKPAYYSLPPHSVNDLSGGFSGVSHNILSGEKSVEHFNHQSSSQSSSHRDTKIETLENIIADKLRVINDLDSKLYNTRAKNHHHNYIQRQQTTNSETPQIISKPLVKKENRRLAMAVTPRDDPGMMNFTP